MQASNTLLINAAMLDRMSKKSINQVFAENLAAVMGRREINQLLIQIHDMCAIPQT